MNSILMASATGLIGGAAFGFIAAALRYGKRSLDDALLIRRQHLALSKLLAEKIKRDAPLKAANAQRKAEADEARRARMAAAEARLTMKGVR